MIELGFFHIKTGVREFVILEPPEVASNQISLTFKKFLGSSEFTKKFESETQFTNPEEPVKNFQVAYLFTEELEKLASENQETITKVSIAFEITSQTPYETLKNGIYGLSARVAKLFRRLFPLLDPSKSTITVTIEPHDPYQISAPELFGFASKLPYQ